jgi:general stress protein YciG
MASEQFPSEEQQGETSIPSQANSAEQRLRGFKHGPELAYEAGHKGGRQTVGDCK